MNVSVCVRILGLFLLERGKYCIGAYIIQFESPERACNWRLVADEPIEFKKQPVEVEDFITMFVNVRLSLVSN